jgi:putative acetyltransferase
VSGGTPSIVPFEPRHADAVLTVIAAVFAEYAMTFDPDDFDADLRDVPGAYLARGGTFVVLVDGDRVVGTVAALPQSATTCELKRLYLLPGYRGRGYGRALVEHVIGWARERGYRELVAWSDVRLSTAHAVYDRMRYTRMGERTVDDLDHSREIGFRLALDG